MDVALAGEDVPRGGDEEEEEDSAEGLEAGELVALFCDERVKQDRAEEKDYGDEALGEDGEGEEDPEGVGVAVGREESTVVCCRKRYPTLPRAGGGG